MENKATSPAHLTTYDPTKDPVIVANTEANRQRSIATGKNLPTYAELNQLREDIDIHQLPYWRGLVRSLKASVETLEGRQAGAAHALKELTALDRPLTSMERSDKADAEEQLDRVAWRLKRDRVRLAAAEGNVKVWEAKAKEFEKSGRQRLRTLNAEENGRSDIRRRNRESNW